MIKKKLIKVLKLIKYKNKKIFGKVGKGNVFTKTAYIDDNAVVGNFNYFGSRTMVLYADIGNYCSIAPNVIIAPANHAINYITTSNMVVNKQNNYEFNLFQERSKIGNDVWIGANTVIKQGVKIGDGSVIGANSFVNTDVPPFSVAVGSPAKIIRKRLDDEMINRIVDSRWWEEELDYASRIVEEIWKESLK